MTHEDFVSACAAVSADTKAAFATLAGRGFALVQRPGFYPRVQAQRHLHVAGGLWSEIGIDFWMSLAECGGYRTEWSLDAPFHLGGCKTVTRMEAGERVRYWKPHAHYSTRPYQEALRTLASDLWSLADELEGWSEDDVVRMGKRARLSALGEMG
ncbi:MAG TPA: hypothetical protein VGL81_25925 [Polyangiaceae bacterium]|jgi:hypothetical protein